MRETASNWLEMAEKVWHYRRDVLSEAERRELRVAMETLRSRLKAKADASQLKLEIEALEPVLERLGGKIYPKTTMIDNVEFLLVAALVVLGIRTFVLQPFKIPTNSMWPSYYGMTVDNLLLKEENPPLAERVFRFVTLGAVRHELVAPKTGEVSAPLFLNGQFAYTLKKGRKWLIIPTQVKEYVFMVGGEERSVQVPLDFNEFDTLVYETYFGGIEGFMDAYRKAIGANRMEPTVVPVQEGSSEARRALVMKFGRTVQQGEPVLRFDILTGDQLFVDRVSYHFVQPRVGDGFVFRTGHIEGIGGDQYYIKRLIGVPGDKLEIREPAIWRNGSPITGSLAFEKNAKRETPYRGYLEAGRWPGWNFLRKGEILEVPKDSYFAMGDNSANSSDGRNWGFVPAKDAVGRPLVIYYPFTRRWGLAR